MAEATINGSTGNQYIDAKIVWSSTPDNQANKSTVTAALYYKRNNTGYTTYGTGTFTITIDGTKTSVTKSLTITNSDWVKAVETTKTVDHKTDGTKSITISATGSISGTSLSSTSCSGTAELDTIPRATTINSVSCATKYFTGKITYKYTPQSASYYNRCTIKLVLSNSAVSVQDIKLGKKSATQQSATMTLASHLVERIYEAMPNVTKGKLRFTFTTYSDSAYSTQVGDSEYKEITLYIPNDSTTKPSVSATLAPVSSLSGDLASLYIQGKSKVKATITTSGKYGASISSTKMVVEGNTYDSGDSYTSDYLSGYGNISVKITTTDSRGFSQSVTKTISVYAYSKPKLLPATGEKSIICARCDADGNLSDSGTYLKVKVKRSISKISGKNDSAVLCRYKAVGTTSYSAWSTLIGMAVSSDEVESAPLFNGVLSVTRSFLVELQVADVVGESQFLEFDVPTEKIYMDRAGSRRSLGIGKYAEADNAIDVADDITLLLGGNKAEAKVSSSGGNITGSIEYASGLLMQWGNVVVTPSAENTPSSVSVTFPTPYKGIPFVVTNPASVAPGTVVLGTCAANVSATGFEATLTRTNLTATHIRWLAIGFSNN